MSLDRTDLRIIRSLTKNSRKSYTDIASEVGVSDTTVRKRVEKMIDEGVIKQFSLLIDYHKVGRIIKAFIGLKINPSKLMDVVDLLVDNPDVQVLYRTTGNWDMFVEVIFKDMEELKLFLESKLSIDAITGTEVNVVIGPYKRCPCTGL